jgi:proton-translocating NADH-quinone oxidoreductase chain N|tara:strand:+ start:273 stop:1097 length:825 start_codon:yes stop_codon:yes gene_type:complete
LLFLLVNNTDSNFLVFDNLLKVDLFTTFVKSILIFSLIFCIIISINYTKKENFYKYEYFLLLGLASLGMFTIVSSNDLITMYLAIEIQSLCFYILATMKIYNNFSTEAGLKYFILGAFSSGILLFGCSFIYGSLGTTNFTEMKILFSNFSDLTDNPKTLLLGIIFVIIAILFKIGAAPFHMWLPDVYEGVPTIVTAVYSIIPKIAIFALFVRLNMTLMYENNFFFSQILLYSAAFSIIIGTLGALYQSKMKRLLAYSAISHVGFLLLGFASFTS